MLDKIRKLMALALNNPSEEEARSAALKAVRLIAEHKVVISLSAAGPAVVGDFMAGNVYEEVLANMRRAQEQAMNNNPYSGFYGNINRSSNKSWK